MAASSLEGSEVSTVPGNPEILGWIFHVQASIIQIEEWPVLWDVPLDEGGEIMHMTAARHVRQQFAVVNSRRKEVKRKRIWAEESSGLIRPKVHLNPDNTVQRGVEVAEVKPRGAFKLLTMAAAPDSNGKVFTSSGHGDNRNSMFLW